MILVDTSIWIDHFRSSDEILVELLDSARVLIHPFVIGELAIGQLQNRKTTLHDLHKLPEITVATPEEVLRLIEHHGLFGSGVGYADANLLASVMVTPGASLWTRDKRLVVAESRISSSSRTPH